MRRSLLVGALAAVFLVLGAPMASAHPLGNFTVNTADRLLVDAAGVHVLHAVDTAEIPTLQNAQSPDGPDADHDGHTTDSELTAWSARQCARLGPALALVLDGHPAPLTLTQASGRLLPGQAGLSTSRLDCTFDSGRAPRSTVTFSDPTSAGRTGWREVSAAALCGQLTGTGGLPETSPSGLLTSYPQDLLSSPLDVTSASFRVTTTGACRPDPGRAATRVGVLPRGVDRLTSSYTDFVGRQHLTLPVALVAVLLAVVLGCGHALAPGHGKTVIAAYLVGQHGTRRQALWLGATVTATHTAGVLLLGALLSLTSLAAPERVVPATEIASGALLAAVGVFLLRRTLQARAGSGDHPHGHDHGEHEHQLHHHDQDHDTHHHDTHHHDTHPHGAHPHRDERHDHGTALADAGAPPSDSEEPVLQPAGATAVGDGGTTTRPGQGRPAHPTPASPALPHRHGGRVHTHVPPADRPLGWRTLAAMGVAGGLVPSPSALVVLLGASALGRPVFGALLVVGYGTGMAITLTVAGLLLLRAQAALHRRGWPSGRGSRALTALPLATAGIVLVVGGIVVLRGLLTLRGLG